MYSYFISRGGGSEPVEVVVEEKDLPPRIIELFAGDCINTFSKLPKKSQEIVATWVKRNY